MTATDRMLLRRGLVLEYATPAWNVVGTVVIVLVAVAAGSVALAGFGVDSLIEIVASTVIVWQLTGGEQAGRGRRALRIIAIRVVLLALYTEPTRRGPDTVVTRFPPDPLSRRRQGSVADGLTHPRQCCFLPNRAVPRTRFPRSYRT